MSSIKEKRELLACKIMLEHYKYISSMNEQSNLEFSNYIESISPAIYAAFKNKGITNTTAINFISTYLKVVKKTHKKLLHIAYEEVESEKIDKARITQSFKILSLMHFNKKSVSVEYISQELKINKTHFCREYCKALEDFLYYMKPIAKKNGFCHELFADSRIIEVMRLESAARSKWQKIV